VRRSSRRRAPTSATKRSGSSSSSTGAQQPPAEPLVAGVVQLAGELPVRAPQPPPAGEPLAAASSAATWRSVQWRSRPRRRSRGTAGSRPGAGCGRRAPGARGRAAAPPSRRSGRRGSPWRSGGRAPRGVRASARPVGAARPRQGPGGEPPARAARPRRSAAPARRRTRAPILQRAACRCTCWNPPLRRSCDRTAGATTGNRRILWTADPPRTARRGYSRVDPARPADVLVRLDPPGGNCAGGGAVARAVRRGRGSAGGPGPPTPSGSAPRRAPRAGRRRPAPRRADRRTRSPR
jgi:hypothetical protein